MSTSVLTVICHAVEQSNSYALSNLSIWVPAIVAVLSLIITIVFTVFVSPKIAEKHNQKVAMYATCVQLFNYLVEVVSFNTFDGVPSEIRKYSIQIHLMFESGEAPKSVSESLEKIYQSVKQRKKIKDEETISEWENSFRNDVHQLRKELAKYVGVFT